MKIYSTILDGCQAAEIAQNLGYSKNDAAAFYFSNIELESDFNQQKKPLYSKFICYINSIDCNLYYDFGADYYFIEQI